MADINVSAPRRRNARQDQVEYRVYFALIFLFALPGAVLSCAWHLLRTGAPGKGPIARARTEAQVLAPMIFCG